MAAGDDGDIHLGPGRCSACPGLEVEVGRGQ